MQEATLSLHNIIEQVSREKGIDQKILVETMEQAILTAAKRTFGINRELEARFNAEIGQVDLFQYMTVVGAVENAEREISAMLKRGLIKKFFDLRLQIWAVDHWLAITMRAVVFLIIVAPAILWGLSVLLRVAG